MNNTYTKRKETEMPYNGNNQEASFHIIFHQEMVGSKLHDIRS